MAKNLRAGVCVSAAIFHEDTLLLVRRVTDYPGAWELPGGSVEEGETLEGALRREAREEAGLDIQVGRPFHVSTFEADGQEGRRVTVVAIKFLCTSSSRDPIQLSSSEHDAFAWVRFLELEKYELSPGFAQVVPEAFRVREMATLLGSRAADAGSR